MKRFLIYCIILIVMLFLGFTTYYFVASKENIALAFDQTNTIKLNVGETFSLEKIILHKEPSANTTISVDISNKTVLEYDQNTETFVALTAGNTTITLRPSNLKFGPFVFNVKVGNGLTQENPYYISNDLELASIGTGDWTLSKCYELIADIYLTTYDWTPLAQNSEFTGVFFGNNFCIFNLTMTAVNQANNAGLFDTIGSLGAVKNVKFLNANIIGSYTNLGVVAGVNKGTISLCEVSTAIITNTKTSESFSGGIVGSNIFVLNGTNCKIARIGMCGVEGLIFTSSSYAGGIAGKNLASLIENCYAVVNSFNGTSAKFGGIVGANIANNTNVYKNSIINNCHAICFSLTNSGLNGGIVGEDIDFVNTKLNVYSKLYFSMNLGLAVGSSNYSNSASTFTKKTEAKMKVQSTYNGWDFVNIWEMASSYAKVNFNKIYTSSIQDIIDITNPNTDENPPIVITEDEIYVMICDMKANPTNNKSYIVSTSYTIDLSESKWNNVFPIGTKKSPFMGQFYTTNGTNLTFKNLSISNSVYQGFFGYIGSGAIIKGINFNNITLSNTNTGYLGAICGYADSNSSIYNCKVNGINISGTGSLGGAVGCNYGTINNVEVNKSPTTSFANSITANLTTSAGGIVGLNMGLVQNSKVSDISIQGANNSSLYVGGVVGYNSMQLENCKAKNINVNASSSTYAKAGGITGGNEKSISKSYAFNVNLTLSSTNKNASCGGITATNSVTGVISNSMWVNGNITSYYAGGICADNYGQIICSNAGNEDYGHGLVKGVYVGGLVYINQQNGQIQNCYVTSVLEGLSSSGVVAGFAYEIKGGSVIQYCFSCAAITGKGDFYADTSSGYKNIWIGIWNGITQTPTGNIKNSLIVNLSGKYIQGYGILIDMIDNPFLTKYEVTCSEADAKGAKNYTCFTSQGFSEYVWNFNYASGHYPTLINAVSIN
ncbi:MAG: GLUG motif-containing protein [Clostridia bacterium]|nr:GLUG motif-containing protein [Clostridia bacterium]